MKDFKLPIAESEFGSLKLNWCPSLQEAALNYLRRREQEQNQEDLVEALCERFLQLRAEGDRVAEARDVARKELLVKQSNEATAKREFFDAAPQGCYSVSTNDPAGRVFVVMNTDDHEIASMSTVVKFSAEEEAEEEAVVADGVFPPEVTELLSEAPEPVVPPCTPGEISQAVGLLHKDMQDVVQALTVSSTSPELFLKAFDKVVKSHGPQSLPTLARTAADYLSDSACYRVVNRLATLDHPWYVLHALAHVMNRAPTLSEYSSASSPQRSAWNAAWGILMTASDNSLAVLSGHPSGEVGELAKTEAARRCGGAE